ncbi:aegyptin-like [Ptychodera flava]|uniref:aegyptin-like n=1 Tax=Ptychodera flava TaxID=63121 RepID=UPI00396A5C3C
MDELEKESKGHKKYGEAESETNTADIEGGPIFDAHKGGREENLAEENSDFSSCQASPELEEENKGEDNHKEAESETNTADTEGGRICDADRRELEKESKGHKKYGEAESETNTADIEGGPIFDAHKGGREENLGEENNGKSLRTRYSWHTH